MNHLSSRVLAFGAALERDRNGRSRCAAACAKEWPPLASTTVPRAGHGAHASLLGHSRHGTSRWSGGGW